MCVLVEQTTSQHKENQGIVTSGRMYSGMFGGGPSFNALPASFGRRQLFFFIASTSTGSDVLLSLNLIDVLKLRYGAELDGKYTARPLRLNFALRQPRGYDSFLFRGASNNHSMP